MSLIDSTYPLFNSGDFNVFPQNMEYDYRAVFDSVCENVEKTILTKLLGDVTYLDYVNNPADYAELINGVKTDDKFTSYTYSGTKYVYYGLKDMLAHFTFFYYVSNRYNFNPRTDEGKQELNRANPDQNKYIAYSNGFKAYYEAKRYIDYKISVDDTLYPDLDFSDIEMINSFGI